MDFVRLHRDEIVTKPRFIVGDACPKNEGNRRTGDVIVTKPRFIVGDVCTKNEGGRRRGADIVANLVPSSVTSARRTKGAVGEETKMSRNLGFVFSVIFIRFGMA